jgi:hypothetical protein
MTGNKNLTPKFSLIRSTGVGDLPDGLIFFSELRCQFHQLLVSFLLLVLRDTFGHINKLMGEHGSFSKVAFAATGHYVGRDITNAIVNPIYAIRSVLSTPIAPGIHQGLELGQRKSEC